MYVCVRETKHSRIAFVSLDVIGFAAGREGAPTDKPPYVEPGYFGTDWGISKQPSQGAEDIAEMTEEEWRAAMEAVR